MSKKVLFEKESRDKLIKGIDTVANAVKITMGPKGRTVVLPKGVVTFSLDGVTVAQSIDRLKDPVENMGAEMVKNVAEITNNEAGDGTTTATILTQSLVKEGVKGIESGIEPLLMKDAISDATKIVLSNLKKKSVKIKDKEQMKSIATISSRDEKIGDIISEIYGKLGKDGVITTEEVKENIMEYEIIDGMKVDSGYTSPYFITNMERKVAVLENPYILVTSEIISRNSDILSILDLVSRTNSKSIVLIADDCKGEAFASMVVNKVRGVLNTLVVKSPGYGDSKDEIVKDICAMTGAIQFSEKLGTSIETAQLEDCGRADRVIADGKTMTIVGGKGNKKDVQERIKSIKYDMAKVETNYKKQILKQRMARLNDGVAVIRVGDITEEASREKQYRIEDAINAVKSALEEGVVKGGGMALYEASYVLDRLIEGTNNNDYRFGLQALQKAIRRPALQILENQGKNAEVVISQGYDLPEEVIDPLKVERVALEQSSSVVGLLLKSGAVIFEEKDEKNNS